MRGIDIAKLMALDELARRRKHYEVCRKMRVPIPSMPERDWLREYERTHSIKECIGRRTAELKAAHEFEASPGHAVWLTEHHLEQAHLFLTNSLRRWFDAIADSAVPLREVRNIRNYPRAIEQRVRPVLNVVGARLDPSKQFESAFNKVLAAFYAALDRIEKTKADLKNQYDCSGSGAKKYLRKIEIDGHIDAARKFEEDLVAWLRLATEHLTGRDSLRRALDE